MFCIITGVGLPVDLDLETVTIGYVFKAEFFIPTNVSTYTNFIADPFDVSTQPISVFDRRRRSLEEPKPTELPEKMLIDSRGFDSEQNEKYEQHQVEAEVVDSGTEKPNDFNEIDYDELSVPKDHKYHDDPMSLKVPQNTATSRWTLYKGIAAMAESKGLAGKPCVLRSICESAHTPFDYSNGILGEIMHIAMSPSTSHDEIVDHTDNEYLHAEKLGSEGAPCEYVFNECKASLLEQFSGVYTPIMDTLKRIKI
ncbi:uncharacterized protein LOC129580374 [Sitodiplosis mosellana]|uniref:uncharacterized protein LOC129580374 n=1 Tax=Sitodiplosis mosellana TaxID=263140 RepID=UPI002443D43E|nr:uncharacterized protein LOC129580374 [Sitodiplosis mosellana]